MRPRPDQLAFALVVLAAAVAAVGLMLAVAGVTSDVVAVGFVAVAAAAGCACVAAWTSGQRADPSRLPLLLAGAALPAFAVFALASVVDDRGGAPVLEVAGLAGVAVAVVGLYRRGR